MQAGLRSWEPDHRDGFTYPLRATVVDPAVQIESLSRRIDGYQSPASATESIGVAHAMSANRRDT